MKKQQHLKQYWQLARTAKQWLTLWSFFYSSAVATARGDDYHKPDTDLEQNLSYLNVVESLTLEECRTLLAIDSFLLAVNKREIEVTESNFHELREAVETVQLLTLERWC